MGKKRKTSLIRKIETLLKDNKKVSLKTMFYQPIALGEFLIVKPYTLTLKKGKR